MNPMSLDELLRNALYIKFKLFKIKLNPSSDLMADLIHNNYKSSKYTKFVAINWNDVDDAISIQ